MATEATEYKSNVVEISDPARWEQEKHSTLRAGLRERNFIDYGGLTVGRIGANVILGDGGWVEHPVRYANEAQAVSAIARITTGLDAGHTITELLPGVDLPEEIVNAWVR